MGLLGITPGLPIVCICACILSSGYIFYKSRFREDFEPWFDDKIKGPFLCDKFGHSTLLKISKDKNKRTYKSNN